jgi:hypothetical protein
MVRSAKVLWLVVVVLLIVLGILFGFVIRDRIDIWQTDAGYYAAVYLDSGEIYFGELHMESVPTLRKVHFLQKDTSGNYTVAKFKDALYGPTDELRLNPDKIIWISPLRDDSQVVSTIRAGN